MGICVMTQNEAAHFVSCPTCGFKDWRITDYLPQSTVLSFKIILNISTGNLDMLRKINDCKKIAVIESLKVNKDKTNHTKISKKPRTNPAARNYNLCIQAQWIDLKNPDVSNLEFQGLLWYRPELVCWAAWWVRAAHLSLYL